MFAVQITRIHLQTHLHFLEKLYLLFLFKLHQRTHQFLSAHLTLSLWEIQWLWPAAVIPTHQWRCTPGLTRGLELRQCTEAQARASASLWSQPLLGCTTVELRMLLALSIPLELQWFGLVRYIHTNMHFYKKKIITHSTIFFLCLKQERFGSIYIHKTSAVLFLYYYYGYYIKW